MPKNEEETTPVESDPLASLHARLDVLEARLKKVEQAAHTSHDLAIGEHEIKAITDAVLPHVNKHLGISGHPARGDQG